jgi:hypothetical protein
MVREHGANLKLKLWHEVSVLPDTDQLFEYINATRKLACCPIFHRSK